MGKFELETSMQLGIAAVLMKKFEKHGLTFGINIKMQPGTTENEWVITWQLITPKGQVPLGTIYKVQKELPKFDINASYGRTVFVCIRGPKDAFLELLQQSRPAVPGSPHTPTPSGSPLPSSQRPHNQPFAATQQ